MTSNRISSSSGSTRVLAHRARRNFPLAVTAFVSTLVLLGVAWTPASAMPKPTPGPSASATVHLLAIPGLGFDCPGTTPVIESEVTGLYWDGRGPYGSADGLMFDSQTWSFVLPPVCPTTKPTPTLGRELNLFLPAAARARFSNAALPKCGRIWLVVPSLRNVLEGTIVGVPGSSTGNVFVYFVPDTDGNGKFEPTHDGVYNLRWQKGIRVTSRTVSGNQTTFLLSTVDPNPSFDLSDGAQLINHSTGADLGFYCVPLDLTVVVTQ
jgi:hypothetical protein